MFKKVLILTAIILAFLASHLQAEQIPVSWDGGGNYNDWDDANNWDPNVVPNNGTDTYAVTINAGTGEVHIGLRQRSTIDQLDCYGEVGLVMGPHDWQSEPVELILVNPNGLTNHGELEIEELEISGNITNTAGAFLELWDVEIDDGNLHNLADAEIEVDGECGVENGGINNAGTLVIDSYSEFWAELNLNNTGQIKLYGGECGGDEIVDNNSTGEITGFGVFYADALCRNKGKIYASGGPLALFSDDGPLINTGTVGNKPNASLYIETAADVNNHGTIEVNVGGGVTLANNLVNKLDSVIKLLGGALAAPTITQAPGATFAGFGGITADVLIDPNGLIELTGPTNIVGDVNISTNATLKISDGQTLITGHTTCKGTIHLIGGTVIFQGGCDCDECNIINEAGIDRNHFDINADGTVNLKDFADFANTWLWQASWY